MNSELRLGYKLYILAMLFASLAIFFQVLPITTSEHFEVKLGLSASNVVNLTSLYFITYAIMQIPSGILFDKYGLKFVLPVSLAIMTGGCILFWTSSNGFLLGLSRLIIGQLDIFLVYTLQLNFSLQSGYHYLLEFLSHLLVVGL